MKSIKMTKKDARILASGHGPAADPLAREYRRRAQEMANESGETVEIYHPDGYVWDARMADNAD